MHLQQNILAKQPVLTKFYHSFFAVVELSIGTLAILHFMRS